LLLTGIGTHYIESVPFAGGSADKIGNRFEGRWTARAALDVLREEAEAIRLEPPGPEGDGVEFWVRFHDRIEFHQVKRQRTAGDWSVSALKSAGVLSTFMEKLKDPVARCTFVSAHSAASLEELSDRAQIAISTTEFERHLSTSVDLKNEFAALSKAWGTPGVDVVAEMLSRVSVVTIGEDPLRRWASVEAERIIQGDHSNILAVLVDILLDCINRFVTPHELWRLLAKRNYTPALGLRPQQAAIQLGAANTAYADSRRSTLIQKRLLPRKETIELVNAVDEHRLVVVDGVAGMGKSDVLLNFLEDVKAKGLPYLAVRLDRVNPTRWPDELGRELHLPANPVASLAAAAQGKSAILILDQLDAVSGVSGRNPQLFDCIAEIVRSAHAVPNLRIVLVCRTFDLQNDARLRQLIELEDRTATITVRELDRAQVVQIVSELGYSQDSLEPRQLDLLSVPLHLALLAEVSAGEDRDVRFQTAMDLYDAFWRSKRRALDLGVSQSPWTNIIERLVDYMSERQVLYAPSALVDAWDSYAEAMTSANVLVQQGKRLSFFHETFFDYAFARTFISKEGSIRTLLAQGQYLFRRAQVRQILAHQRQSALEDYRRDLSFIVDDPSVRFHLKEVVVAWLAHVRPMPAEWNLVQPRLMQPSDPLFARAWRTLLSLEWFRYADTVGFIDHCLTRGDAALIERVVGVLAHVVADMPDRVAEILSLQQGTAAWRKRVLLIATQSDLGLSRALFELFCKAIESDDADGADDGAEVGHALRSLSKSKPEWGCELLGRYLACRTAQALARGFANPFEDKAAVFAHFLHLEEVISSLGIKAPVAYCEHTLPVLVKIVEQNVTRDAAGLRVDGIWTLRHFGGGWDLEKVLLYGAERAIGLLASNHQEKFDGLLARFEHTEYETVAYLVSIGFIANPGRYAEAAVDFLLGPPLRFEIHYSNDSYWGARLLLEAVTPHVSIESMARLQEALLKFYPDIRWTAGRAQFALLGGIVVGRRSDVVSKRLAELARKFQQEDASRPEGIVSGNVRSPIAPHQAKLMSNGQWLAAMAKYQKSHREQRRIDFLRGGAEELARVLEREAREDPERFAALAMAFPEGTNFVYFEAVLRGVSDARETLPLASVKVLVERCHAIEGRPCGRWIARPLKRYAGNVLPRDLLDIVAWYALNDPDPVDDEAFDEDDAVAGRLDLINRGLNSVRGGVAGEVADLLEANIGNLEGLEHAVESLVTDKVVAVRAMAASIVCALVSERLSVAQALFDKLVQCADDRILSTHHVHHYLLWQGSDDFEQLRPTVERMVRSTYAGVRQAGAVHTCLIAFTRSEYEGVANAIVTDVDEARRIGAAEVYKANLTVERCAHQCVNALKLLFEDSSAKVRSIAGDAIWRLDGTELGTYLELAKVFLHSSAFTENADDLIHALVQTTSAVPELILDVCEHVLAQFANRRDGHGSYNAGRTLELVFRAYADADASNLRERALDLVDRSLLLDVFGTNKILAEHDRWWGVRSVNQT
jgi:hypothetical protein